jgi:hypothetical protein
LIPVRYHAAAEDELLREIEFLEGRARGLGRRFFGEIQRTENRISEFPQSAEEVRPGIRKCRLRKFRYALIYAAFVQFGGAAPGLVTGVVQLNLVVPNGVSGNA